MPQQSVQFLAAHCHQQQHSLAFAVSATAVLCMPLHGLHLMVTHVMQSITLAGMGRRQAPVHPLAELAEAKVPAKEMEEDASPDSADLAAWMKAAQHKLQDIPIWTVHQKRNIVLLQKDPVRPLMCICTGLA